MTPGGSEMIKTKVQNKKQRTVCSQTITIKLNKKKKTTEFMVN